MNKNDQQQLLIQLRAENQELLEFKILNNLISKSMQALTENIDQAMPFSVLFSLVKQELKPDLQLIVTCNPESTELSILACTHEELIGKHITFENTKTVKFEFRETTVINLDSTSNWSSTLKRLLPQATSALIQPVKFNNSDYAVILLKKEPYSFNSGAQSIISNYCSFIANTLTLRDYRHIAAERESLFAQQKRIENSLAKQGKLAAIGQLAAGVAHELNNPLGFIYSNLKTLDVYLKDINSFINEVNNTYPEINKSIKKHKLDFILKDSIELINESQEGARRARDIIKNLRNFTHPDEQTISTINIVKLVEDTVKIAKVNLKKHIKINLTHHLESALAKGNTTQLSQAILNIINNSYYSIKHQKGLIEIDIMKINHWINIEIKDNGNGIHETDIPHIFEPFLQQKKLVKVLG
ncbi:ATP-binding protein [Shewanella xiamenensis]|uniref:sensor histidine kinase n=1 Tax=Shewanella sp. POL2 TaxID=1201295 RepID=UPI00002D9FFB|nr:MULTISPECIES: ATP-binding protein [Shewanella]MCT8859252.1 two-component sensor histidine kinase [Shewanella xiamenensis]MDH1626111.1 ATP-binding protein [Shewanella xiamenensis]MDV5249112.1 histidine kinase dimerization/phospho-acceptor domain-containing protein [Shewanella xiamenensis]UWG62910.1 ATP-binding protein [Shewanella xiamenensis]